MCQVYNHLTYGLISFLIAHICYLVYFWQIGKLNRKNYRINPFIVLGVLIYSVLFYLWMHPNLGGMVFPVLIYVSVISLMLILCFNAFDLRSNRFGQICLAGTMLFALSDSILAIDRFIFPIHYGGVFVMLTYAVGQLLITEGSLRNLRNLNPK